MEKPDTLGLSWRPMHHAVATAKPLKTSGMVEMVMKSPRGWTTRETTIAERVKHHRNTDPIACWYMLMPIPVARAAITITMPAQIGRPSAPNEEAVRWRRLVWDTVRYLTVTSSLS